MKNIVQISILSTLILLGMAQKGIGQERKLHKANKKYKELAFVEASKIYTDVAESGYKSVDFLKKLGNSYYFNAKYKDAAKWYEELFSQTQTVDPVYYIRYSQSLKAIGLEELSSKWFDKYLGATEISEKKYKSVDDYMRIIEENSDRYQMEPLSINTEGIEFGATFSNRRIIFASTRDTGAVFKRISAWEDLPFLDLYEAHQKPDGSLTSPKKLRGKINSKGHESTPIFTRDGNTMYFTRSNNTRRIKKTKDQVQHLKIYRAHLVNGKWTDIEDLSINGDNYSTAHPALSPSEDKLYFVSNMPGSIGQTDIYVARINADKSLGKSVNLGKKINTKGRESFPFITEDNELYFSSDGHFGLGGYDVFFTRLNGTGFGSLLNVGKPINSSFDDFAFAIKEKKGFVSSNRPGGAGRDDIYGFIELKDIKELLVSKIYGTVVDKDTKFPLVNSIIDILDEQDNQIAQLRTNAEGHYVTEADIHTGYHIKVSNEGYMSEHVFSKKDRRNREHNFELSKDTLDLKKGIDIAKIVNARVYFDLDKSAIRSDAARELEKIVTIMKAYPELNIHVRSHTDSRARDGYNLALSERRARATVNHLIKRGIQRTRLSGKGYGEKELVNQCSNGIKCSEAQHQLNRRSEFIIVE
ncbi:OmpA family protein [Ulvibacterium sp.]|uniref:OmpA family protein n=1 Tax=Ulvibacterium sp. TaxID=2665914 RepID=UPI003BAAF2A4